MTVNMSLLFSVEIEANGRNKTFFFTLKDYVDVIDIVLLIVPMNKFLIITVFRMHMLVCCDKIFAESLNHETIKFRCKTT